MVRLKMSETLTEAATYIEQGHVRVGPHAVTDPAVSPSLSRWVHGGGAGRVRMIWGSVDLFYFSSRAKPRPGRDGQISTYVIQCTLRDPSR